jgi:MFS transporter
MSVPIGGWAARVPEVRRQIEADDALWGLVNTIASIGNIVGICAIVLVVGRVRSTVLAPVAAGVVLLSAPITAASTSVTGVMVGLATWALVAFVMAVPMGAMALEVQRRFSRPLMGSFDACFGAGVLTGGATGTVSAALDVHPWVQLAVTSGLLGLGLAAVARWLPAERPRTATARQAPLWRRLNRRILTVVAMAFLSGFVTEASILWSAIYIADTMQGGPVLGGAAYTSAAAAGILTLMFVDRITTRVGLMRFVRVSTLFAAAGFCAFLTITSPWAAIAGFSLLSVGMACVNPSIYTLAGGDVDLSASEGVSVVEIAQVPGGAIVAPALIGALSSVVGLRIALGSIVLAALLLSLLAGQARSPKPA